MSACSYHYALDQVVLQHIENDKTFWPWEKGCIHYIEKGKGQQHVVLLHGFGVNTFNC